MEQITDSIIKLVYVFIPFIILALVLRFLGEYLKKKKKKEKSGSPEILPYIGKPVFTAAELRFFNVLKAAVPNGFYLFPKVRIADFIKVDSKDNFYRYFNEIKAKHVDFLICDKNGYARIAFELDDRTHERDERRKRDDFVNKILKEASIGIIHETVKSDYSESELRKKMLSLLPDASGAEIKPSVQREL